jgi:hypothetical protein
MATSVHVVSKLCNFLRAPFPGIFFSPKMLCRNKYIFIFLLEGDKILGQKKDYYEIMLIYFNANCFSKLFKIGNKFKDLSRKF